MARNLTFKASGPPRGFRAYLTRAHDGDSFWVMCDTGFDGRHEPELRLEGVRAPELGEAGAQETLDFVNGWLASTGVAAIGRRWPLWVDVTMTTAFEPDERMTFTRYLAYVYPFTRRTPESSLNVATQAFLDSHPEWGKGK